MEVWADRVRLLLVILIGGLEFIEIPWKGIDAGFDQERLSPDGKYVHTKSGTRSRFKCRCQGSSSASCPTHAWYNFPTHWACRGDGCEACGGIGYVRLKKEILNAPATFSACASCIKKIKYQEKYYVTKDGSRHHGYHNRKRK